ncbi:MAG: hypothetical protein NTV23_08675 [Propionibacteriales bacterium]|nr:hypothetical protein [Propionibacteriales bacterium]
MIWSGWSELVLAAALVVSGPRSAPVFAFADDRINESSGLVDLGALMVTTNDSGGEPLVFVVDARTGRTVATTTFADEVEDVEALAPAGDGAVWVGDIGDNRARRDSVRVYLVPVGATDRTVTAPSYELVYPDGAHDAESLLQGPDGRLRIVTKGLFGGQVFVAPKNLDPDRPNRLAAGPTVDFYATDAALFGDGRHVLVRGYGGALVATYPGFRPVAELALPDQEQGEGVSIGPRDRIRVSSEGVRSEVLQVALPQDVRDLVDGREPVPAPGAGLDSDGVVDSAFADGLDRRWLVLAGALAAVLGWRWLRGRR